MGICQSHCHSVCIICTLAFVHSWAHVWMHACIHACVFECSRTRESKKTIRFPLSRKKCRQIGLARIYCTSVCLIIFIHTISCRTKAHCETLYIRYIFYCAFWSRNEWNGFWRQLTNNWHHRWMPDIVQVPVTVVAVSCSTASSTSTCATTRSTRLFCWR